MFNGEAGDDELKPGVLLPSAAKIMFELSGLISIAPILRVPMGKLYLTLVPARISCLIILALYAPAFLAPSKTKLSLFGSKTLGLPKNQPELDVL